MPDQTKRKVNARDVAQRAGVSKWTVSRAFTEGASISQQAREKILNAAEELGYRPNLLARSLTTRHTNIVGLVVDEMENPNILQVLDGVTRHLQQKGYMSMLLNISSDKSQYSALSLADQFQVDGLIFLGTILTDELIQLAKDIRNIPLIVLYRNSDNPNIQVVTTDGYRAGVEIAGLFAEQHYQRIGYMAGPFSQSTELKRLDGFRDGLTTLGLRLGPLLEAGHYQRASGFRAMNRYLETTASNERIKALFCENDILAIGALDALRAQSETIEMAVVGFDDIEFAASPSYDLTTYSQPLDLLVSEAIRRLASGVKTPSRYLAPGRLILRSSHQRNR